VSSPRRLQHSRTSAESRKQPMRKPRSSGVHVVAEPLRRGRSLGTSDHEIGATRQRGPPRCWNDHQASAPLLKGAARCATGCTVLLHVIFPHLRQVALITAQALIDVRCRQWGSSSTATQGPRPPRSRPLQRANSARPAVKLTERSRCALRTWVGRYRTSPRLLSL